jgi:hypothetical protein
MFSASISMGYVSQFSYLFCHFMGYSAHSPVPEMISCYSNDRYMVREASEKLVFFMFSASISMGYSSQFSSFLPISWAIAFISSSQDDF